MKATAGEKFAKETAGTGGHFAKTLGSPDSL